jgi:NAD(P)-dependent dehydrogenase (short-subunit alcohol dehydrogenase family)
MSPSTDSTRSALVTGASGGIGRACAVLLARAGYDLLLTGRSQEKLDAARAAIESEAASIGRIEVSACDLTADDVPRRLVEAAVDRFGRLDALVHVAGDAPLGPIDRITPAGWRQCVDTNLSALVLLTAAAWPVFARQKAGMVASVSSMASVDPFPGFSMYAAAKTGVNMFTHCVGVEGRGLGIRAVAVAPGAVETPMLRALFDESALPREQVMDPMAVAAVLVDCITGRRAFESGQTILLPSGT